MGIRSQNNPIAAYLDVFSNTGTDAAVNPSPSAPGSLTATGGIVSDYTSGSDVYRAHIFTSSGALNVTALGSLGNNVDYLCVAGGGGNQSSPQGSNRESGSGAGGLLSSHPDVPATFKQTQVTISSTGNINIVVGGGAGSKTQGSPSSIAFSSPVSTVGGGHGANQDDQVGGPGGSGGGNWYSGSTPGQATNYPGPNQQGYPGGTQGGTNNWTGGAGGGAGAQGANNGTSYSAGRTISITGSAVEYSRGGKSNSYPSTPRSENGIFNTGGGASGVGNGGSGIVVVRYKIAELTGNAKASGGAISFYGNKTIHAFTSSGAFTTNAGFNETVEYVIVGGGGGGGAVGPNAYGGAGGGAGQMRTGSISVNTGSSTPMNVVIGAGAAGHASTGSFGNSGVNSSIAFPGGTTIGYGGGGGSSNTVNSATVGANGNNYPNGTTGSGSGGGASSNSTNGEGGPAPLGAYPGGSQPIRASSKGYGGAGGGGAGGAGGDGPSSPGVVPAPWPGGAGGVGAQLPTTFRNPLSATSLGTPGPGSTTFLVAGGGAGGIYVAGGATTNAAVCPGGGGGAGGQAAPNTSGGRGGDALSSTGGGGGGAGSLNIGSNFTGGSGGSGLVLIAYPS